jgi:sec-independent protein translocase protein TatB
MFDIGFSEIIVIAGLSLVVLGPKKLPGVVRTMGRWAGRARAMARQFRDQLEAEADNFKVDLNTQASPGASPTGSGGTAAAAAAAAPTPPPEFTGAPLEAVAPTGAAAPAEAAPAADSAPAAAAAPVVETPEFPSANDSGHADLGLAEPPPAAAAAAAGTVDTADATPAHRRA